ncbi:MAG TPA: hypothetical protein VFA42_05535 [Gaiellaceae bacterium]|nr:hypothetical protein [Gaiellaceae bacterium]
MREVRAVWGLLAAELLAVLVTYSRLPPSELYSVTGTGFRAGLSRVVVELNFPDALIALGILGVLWPYIRSGLHPLAGVAALMCAFVVLPGVVKQDDLDARWLNAVPAVGVAIALALSFGADVPRGSARGDRIRIGLGALLVLLAAPWIAAALGFYLDGVPVLHWLFQTGRLASFHDPLHHAVHHGIHHGLQGLLFALSALVLSRVPSRALGYLSLMLAYGMANMLNDGWLEQVVERGWTSNTVPSVLGFSANWLWGAVLVTAAAVWAAARRGGLAPRPPRTAARPS